MRAACARKLQLGMQRSAGTGEKYDGEKTWTKAARFRDYNSTVKENMGRFKSIIVMVRIRINCRVSLLICWNKTGEEVGGRRGVRTPDPRIANAVLSQLS